MAPELGQEIQALALEIDNRQHCVVHEFNEQHHFSIDVSQLDIIPDFEMSLTQHACSM